MAGALVALALVVIGAGCAPQDERAAFDAVNALRSENGLPALSWNEAVHGKVEAWSDHMADSGQLSHSTLSAGVPTGWSALGENVAVAGSVQKAIDMLEASPPHRANMLNASFRSLSVGIEQRDGRVWVTELFIG
jgi:uncharacterized protein YkwD